MKTKAFALFLLVAPLLTRPASARVIPISPFGPAGSGFGQSPPARHMLGWIEERVGSGLQYHVRVIDPQGEAPPRLLPDPPGVWFQREVAGFEEPDGTYRLLEWWTFGGGTYAYIYSPDSGSTWTRIPWSGASSPLALRLGSSTVPFVLAVNTREGVRYWGVRADGSTLFLAYCDDFPRLLGSDSTGTRFLIAAQWFAPASGTSGPAPHSVSSTWTIGILDLEGHIQTLFAAGTSLPTMSGWITSEGAAYFDVQSGGNHSVRFWNGGTWNVLASTPASGPIAAPSADFARAWIVTSGAGQILLRTHSANGGLVERWRVPSTATPSGIFSGRTAERVLVATRRSRWDSSVLGIALWEEGAPPPPLFDEVILNWNGAGVVRIDPDEVARGGAMLLWSGMDHPSGCADPCPPEPDPIGLVRVALKQRLVIPAAARLSGAHGADWRTDLVVRNPNSSPLGVSVRFLPNPQTAAPAPDATLTLQPNETRLVPDVLSALFDLERGSGALLLVPEGNGRIRATSRTYTRTDHGTYGMSVDGVDAQNAARANLTRTISAGLLGSGFRSNFVAADVSGVGSNLDVLAAAPAGSAVPLATFVAANSQTQIDDLANMAGAASSEMRPLVLTPLTGAAMTGVMAIDDRTNDPSWFGTDLIAGSWILPALVHADGMNGARYRTDLYLYNPQSISRGVSVAGVWFTLAPGEFRVVPDVLRTVLGRTGVAWGDIYSFGVQVTSRTYTENPDGSTYGMVVPPLDEMQRAVQGETLEIVGPTGGPGFRTNLTLLQLGFGEAHHPRSAHVQILDGIGSEVDAFDVQLEDGARLQIDDLFHTRGLGDGPDVCVIRVTPSDGYYAAYATTIDNGTNDPVYFAGALGSH